MPPGKTRGTVSFGLPAIAKGVMQHGLVFELRCVGHTDDVYDGDAFRKGCSEHEQHALVRMRSGITSRYSVDCAEFAYTKTIGEGDGYT